VCTHDVAGAHVLYVVDSARVRAGRATVVGVGFVLALTLPGLVLLLLGVAAVDQVMLRLHGRGIVGWRRDSQVSSTGFDLLHAALSPGKADELAERRHQELVRDEEAEGAPPRSTVDLDAGIARLRLPPR
jgi:Family of unknown function (DUF6191)